MTVLKAIKQRAGAKAGSWLFNWTASQVSILLTIVALILGSYSITQARFEIGFYGLIAGFPVTFFVALGILTLASAILWFSKENHGKLLFVQLCILIAAVWLAPVIVRGAQPFAPGMYSDLGYADYIVREGHFSGEVAWQHNWPSAWIFWAEVSHCLGVDLDSLARLTPWLPFLWQIFLFPVLFLFFRNTLGASRPNVCWAAMFVFYSAMWFETQNTGAQAFGVFFFFSILAVLTTTSVGKRAFKSFGHRLTGIIILAASAVAHLLGSLAVLASMGGLVFSKRVRAPDLLTLAILFVLTWSLFGAMSYFEWRVPQFLESGFRIDRATEIGILSPMSGSESHAAVALVRLLLSGLILALAVLGGLLGWRLKDDRHADVTVLAIVAACGFAAILVGAGYAHELYQRFFVFLLPALAYFGVKLLHFRAVAAVFVLVLLAAVPLLFVSRYGNQGVDYISRGYLSGAHFFHESTTNGYVTGETPIGRVKNIEGYRTNIKFEDLRFLDRELFITGGYRDPFPHYVCVSNHEEAMYAFYYGDAQFIGELQISLESATNVDMVYANPDLRLYVAQGT